jgi:multiple sugar transport system substrate-binding protein
MFTRSTTTVGRRASTRLRPNKVKVTGLIAVSFLALSVGSTISASATASKKATVKSGASYPVLPSNVKTSITLASYLPTLGAAATSTLNSMISGFEALHPNITVTVEPEASTAAGAISGQLQQDAISGKRPQLVQVPFDELPNVVTNFKGVDLTKVIGATSLNTEWGGKYPYATAITNLGVLNGDVYGVPWVLSTPVLFINDDLFNKAGLNPHKPPTNWTQLAADALAISKVNGSSGFENGCIGTAAGGTDWCLQSIIDSAGGSVMNAKQSAITFNSPGVIQAITQMQSLAQSGAMVNLSIAQAVQAWGAGKLGMFLDTSALQSGLVAADAGNFTMDAALEPGFGKSLAVPTNSGSAIVMLASTKANREAAWELEQYLTSPESETSITKNIGYVPLRTSITTARKYLAGWANNQQFVAPNIEQLNRVQPWLAYPGPNFAAIMTALQNASTTAIFQNANVQSTLAGAQSSAAGLLG